MARPLLASGRMPNLSRIVEGGAHGTLRSISPALSPAVWTTLYSGVPRAEHTVRSFAARSTWVAAPRVWDLARGAGLRCGLYGSLVTWPPYDLGAFMIPDQVAALGMDTLPARFAELQRLAYHTVDAPRGALRRLVRLYAFGARPRTLAGMAADRAWLKLRRWPREHAYWRAALWWARVHGDVFTGLLREHAPDFATFHFHASDTLGHQYWHCHEPQAFADVGREELARCGPAIRRCYETADRILGKVMAAVGPEATYVVLSDHGFQAFPQRQKALRLRLPALIEALGLTGRASGAHLAGGYTLDLREGGRVEEFAATLREARSRVDGQPVFERVHAEHGQVMLFTRWPEVPEGPIDLAGVPDRAFASLFVEDGVPNSGVHALDGMIALAGPEIQVGAQLSPLSILDAAPILLTALGLPVPEAMSHAVPAGLFREGVEPRRFAGLGWASGPGGAEEAQRLSDEERRDLERRLVSLGYM